jgi:hypothetical protein
MSGTDVLIDLADSFREQGEATDLLVVYADENGNVYVKGNCSLTRALGLATYAKAHCTKALLESAQ